LIIINENKIYISLLLNNFFILIFNFLIALEHHIQLLLGEIEL
jgi:hypothetical protein